MGVLSLVQLPMAMLHFFLWNALNHLVYKLLVLGGVYVLQAFCESILGLLLINSFRVYVPFRSD